ncbi:MFS transporter [Maritalea mediterranea]|uniref:MFS transporter n=1 Tax=Maritalea mediterranea TaxID=2909667 RepID=A0ABS9E6V7_9HYPH|nr:MFS transporter [Maritalea mediterranea]MCF4097186.1 MFS transporter [Maritalea mediterranea]
MSLISPSPPLSELNRRQVQWIGAGFIMTFASMGGQTIFIAQFNTEIRSFFNLTDGQFGQLYMLATLASAVLISILGNLADRIGPRLLGIICMVGLAVMTLVMSQVGNIVFLVLALFGLRFFGQGMLPHVAQTAMARWFNRFRGRALAFSQMGYTLGEATLPFSVTVGILAIGWRNVWIVAAGVLIVLFIPIISFLLRDPPDGKRAKARGEVNPDGADDGKLTGEHWTRANVLKDPLFYVLVFGAMTLPALATIYFFHQAHLVDIKGWSVLTYTAWLPLMSVTNVGMALVTGFLVDRFGAFRILPFFLVPMGIASLVMASFDAQWAIPLFFIFVAFSGGMAPSVAGALWAEIYGTAHIGGIRALAIAGMVFASAAGPGISGMLIDADINLAQQSWGNAIYCFAISALYLALQPKLKARRHEMMAN